LHIPSDTEHFPNPARRYLIVLARMNSGVQRGNRLAHSCVKLASRFSAEQGCPEHQSQLRRLVQRRDSGEAAKFVLGVKILGWRWQEEHS
jgi:hypothetical protein